MRDTEMVCWHCQLMLRVLQGAFVKKKEQRRFEDDSVTSNPLDGSCLQTVKREKTPSDNNMFGTSSVPSARGEVALSKMSEAPLSKPQPPCLDHGTLLSVRWLSQTSVVQTRSRRRSSVHATKHHSLKGVLFVFPRWLFWTTWG